MLASCSARRRAVPSRAACAAAAAARAEARLQLGRVCVRGAYSTRVRVHASNVHVCIAVAEPAVMTLCTTGSASLWRAAAARVRHVPGNAVPRGASRGLGPQRPPYNMVSCSLTMVSERRSANYYCTAAAGIREVRRGRLRAARHDVVRHPLAPDARMPASRGELVHRDEAL